MQLFLFDAIFSVQTSNRELFLIPEGNFNARKMHIYGSGEHRVSYWERAQGCCEKPFADDTFA